MSCAPFDLRDYHFDVLPKEDRVVVEEHLGRCDDCAGDLERLRVTGLALAAIPDEEIPRRIGFVSDKVFAPSPVSRWWQALWASGARLTAASMALLAVAILVHAFRPPPFPMVVASNPPQVVANTALDSAAMQAAIDKAVAKVEARYDVKLQQIAAENSRQKIVIERAAEKLETLDRRARVMMVASNRESFPVTGQ